MGISDTYIDGEGFQRDEPLPRGTRIRFSTTDWGEEDLVVYVEGNRLMVVGIKRSIQVEPRAANTVAVHTQEVARHGIRRV